MKRSQIILFAFFIIVSGLIYFKVVSNKKPYKKNTKEESKTVYVPAEEVKNMPHEMTMNSYGQISPVTELMVSFEVQGRLLEGSNRMKPGISFRKSQVLYKLDRQELALTIASRKTALAGMVAQSMPDIVLDFPTEVKKWDSFLTALKPDVLLPELPPFSNTKERLFWTTRNMLTEYYNILSLEKRMEKYAYIAPFSGTVLEIYAEPGSIVNPGVQVAKIARTGEFELKVPVPLEDLDNYKNQKTAEFINSDGVVVATGNIIRISDVVNQRTQSADIYYSVKPSGDARIYNGMYLNVSIKTEAKKNTVILPRTAVNDSQVFTLSGTKLTPQEVQIVGNKPDSVYVRGLKDGQMVVMEQVGKPSQDIIYKRPKDK